MSLSPVFERELRRSPLFSSISKSNIQQVFDSADLIHKRQNEMLFSQGDQANHFFLLRTGTIRLYLLSPDGNEKTLNILQPGNSFAEAVMFMEGNSYPVNSQFLEDGEVFAFNSQSYLAILRNNPEISFSIMADLSRQLQNRVSEIGDLCLNNATSRLINYLITLMPPGATAPVEIVLPTQKSMIASRLSIQRETFSRILGKLKKEQVIKVQGNTIQILEPETLQQMLLAQ